MMKKSLLLLGALGVAFAANAQLKMQSSVMLPMPRMQEASRTPEASPMPIRNTGKTAGLHTRRYNYVEHLAKANSAILSNSSYFTNPYMWGKPYGQAIYSATGGGYVLDTITLRSYGAVLHPFWSAFNSNSYTKGTMVITNATPYVVDSVYFSAYYGRSNTKPSVTDIVRIAFTYSDGSSTSNFSTGWYSTGNTAAYGVDTIREAGPIFDLTTRTMRKKSGSTGPAIWTQDINLGPTDTGSRTFAVHPNINVPAGNILAATITFISGEEATYPAGDTIFRGSLSSNDPFKYGMLRPYIYYEKISGSGPAFPTYTPGNYNSGVFLQNPTGVPSTYDTVYSSSFFWSTGGGTGASGYQFPDVDFVLSCATCSGVGVASIDNYVSMGVPYPNPANSSITLPVTMKESATLNVSLSNVMGQVVASQRFAEVGAKQTKNVQFNTASLPAGIYLLTAEVNGEHQSIRVSVTH